MATSDFKIFANGQSLVGEETLNIAPLDDEQLVTETKTGFYSGLASSKKFNRVLRQGTAGTATIADLIVEVLAEDVKDDGTPLKEQLRRAITKTVELDTKSFVRTINGEKPDGSGNFAIDVGVKTVNSLTPDDNGNIEVQAGHALGDTWISFDSTVPAGGVPFCGQLVSRDLWADLYAWATAQGKVKTESEWQEYATAHGGNCPFYSDGDGSDTFRMPKVSAYFKGADSAEEGGTWIAEGLPNIEGTLPGMTEQAGSDTTRATKAFKHGALNSDGLKGLTYSASTQNSAYKITEFDASWANPIYGNSEHVTPETCVVLVGVWALGNISTTGNTTIDAVASAVASIEANIAKRLPDSTVHIIETWVSEDGDSWYRKYSDGWIEQGGVTDTGVNLSTVTLLTAFSSTTYSVQLTQAMGYSCEKYTAQFITANKTETSFQAHWGRQPISTGFLFWCAYGY